MAPEVSSLLWQNAQIFISIIMEFPLFYEALPTGEIGKGKKNAFSLWLYQTSFQTY